MNYEQPEQESMDAPQSADTEAPADIEVNTKNLAKGMDGDRLREIGYAAKEGYEADEDSRQQWKRDLDAWVQLAMQVREEKSFPWRGSANVKYPLLSTAAMQFSARAYPSLIPSDGKIVKAKVVGKDPVGAKNELADRVATYMSYQILNEMHDWEEDMDKLLIMLPIIGTMFKKTYWDPHCEQIKSCLIMPKDLIVNHWASDLDSAERVSEVIQMSKRVYNERLRTEVFIDADIGDPTTPADERNPPPNDSTTPYTFIEQHTYLDVNDDGYEEPVIITFHKESGKVVRIVNRFELDDVELDDKEKIKRIKPTQYYTKYSFVPNPDGGFYSIGFGVLLGPINEAINTNINQLIDSGSLNNLQAGFIGKGLRIKMGDTQFTPGEWKSVNSTADDLKKQIFPLPTKEPSGVLLELMTAMISAGKELASVAEIFVGKMPGQNTPATTTMASIEQGMKVFTAVYKRIYRSLESEFKKIFKLNAIYLDPNHYVQILDTAVGPDDFDEEKYDICPGADPTAVSQTERLMKAQALLELLPTGLLDPMEVLSRVFQAQEQPNWQILFSKEIQATGQVPPQPDPKMLEMQMKMQLEQQKAQMNQQQMAQKMEYEKASNEAQLAMKAQEHQVEMQGKMAMAQADAGIAEHKQKIFMAQGAMDLQHKQDAHEQTMQQKKETSALQAKNSSSTGSGTKSQKPSPKR